MKEFEKLNRIGEGTYGIVCEWPVWGPGTMAGVLMDAGHVGAMAVMLG